MKKLLITLLAVCFTTSALAQLRHFFPDSNSYFSVSDMKFWFEGDTIINGLQYKKVYKQENARIADFNEARYFAAIREDTIAARVYCHYNGAEYLLYDFSVNVGDVVHFYSFWHGIPFRHPFLPPRIRQSTVSSIDSILIDNEYRKRINFFSDFNWPPFSYSHEFWIEGIGSTNGLFFAGEYDMLHSIYYWLLCVHIDGRKVFPAFKNCLQDCCFMELHHEVGYPNITEDKNKISLIITNTNELLYIETDKDISGFEYKIINSRGQLINNGTLFSNTVNISTLSKGLYIIIISNNSTRKMVGTEKFIKR